MAQPTPTVPDAAERPPRIVVVMPAFNAGRTLRRTYQDLPRDSFDLVILVDDASTDDTMEVARQLDLRLFAHDRNRGYGANQKTCYKEALREGADVIVMVHPDYQYDPRLLPEIVRPILEDRADFVLGSRFKSGGALAGGMPWWKYFANRALTRLENGVFGQQLSEYHTGYRAYHRRVLETVRLDANSDHFLFDQEIVAQALLAGFRIAEVAVPTRYFAEASSAGFWASLRYGIGIPWLLVSYLAHRSGLVLQRQFSAIAGSPWRAVDLSRSASRAPAHDTE